MTELDRPVPDRLRDLGLNVLRVLRSRGIPVYDPNAPPPDDDFLAWTRSLSPEDHPA